MSDKEEKRDIGHAMFGFNEPRPSRSAPNPPPATPQPATSQAGPAQGPPQGANQGYPGSGQPPQAPPGQPQYIYVQAPPPTAAAPPPARSTSKIVIGVLALLVILAGVNLYLAMNQRKIQLQHGDQLTVLTKRMDSSDDRYAQLKGQFDVTSEKLGMTQQELARARRLSANIQRQQRAAVKQLNTAIQQKANAQDLNKLQTEANSKFGSLSGDIAGNKKDLEATKQALVGTKGELSGAIARTHDELVALAHRTDRDYYEFNLPKKHARKKIGSIMVELLKTNRKQNLYTIDLFFDDKRTQRKNQALDQPVFFYVDGAKTALELVVNKLDKNRISGYISTPKGLFPKTPNVLSARPT